MRAMLILGIESSCDETGVALYALPKCACESNENAPDDLLKSPKKYAGRLVAHALHSQILMHQAYGGVVPELASRDHIRRFVPLLRQVIQESGLPLTAVDAVAYTQGPGLAGALLAGAAFAEGLALSLNVPVIPIHHLEGHLLSPLLSARPPAFPFIALLVSGGHSQLMHVAGVGQYTLLGESLDDAAGEAFDKTAKLLGLPYPGGAALSELAKKGNSGVFKLPRPMLHSNDLNFSFSGLKTAVLTRFRALSSPTNQQIADMARAFEEAIVEVLVEKSMRAVKDSGLTQLVVAGGVGANGALRSALNARTSLAGIEVFYPELEFCTDNGAMIALAGALRFNAGLSLKKAGEFSVKPRWPLAQSL